MTGAIFAVVVIVFAVGAFLVVRRTQRGAFVDRLPLEDGEQTLLTEQNVKVWQRFRKMAVRDGGTTTYKVHSTLTDRRVILATGGPEGKHRFTILAILDYTTPSPPVPEAGYEAYKRKFGLSNGYPTYGFSAGDLTLTADGLTIVVPFPEAGERWGPPPEVRIDTTEAARYRDAVAAVRV
jgi:hypothetical protein